ncbi:MAG TPA: class I SAM-dependent methyltransferase [Bacillota bacterium]
MADHYYTLSPTSSHQAIVFEVKLRGVWLKLHSDAGVFSKCRLDNGTKLLVEALRLSPEWRKILDLGCGYGPIGLTIAKLLPQATVYLSDINERAVALAKLNAKINQIKNVEIKAGDGFAPFANERFDLIVTNPPIRAGKAVIYAMIDAGADRLNVSGWFVAVVATKQGAKSYERKMAEVFGNVTELEKGGGYRVIASQRL